MSAQRNLPEAVLGQKPSDRYESYPPAPAV